MHDPAVIAEQYIALWNETDPAKRRTLLEKGWTSDATYVDPLMRGQGQERINALIGGVHKQFPGFRFTLLGNPSGYGEFARFSWALGPAGQEAPIGGSDVVELAGGRLRSVIGFLDKVPATA
jgi:hypothetical protein